LTPGYGTLAFLSLPFGFIFSNSGSPTLIGDHTPVPVVAQIGIGFVTHLLGDIDDDYGRISFLAAGKAGFKLEKLE